MKKMTFWEGVKVSWARELQIGNPLRIIRLAFGTVWYSLIYFLFVMVPRALTGKTDWRK